MMGWVPAEAFILINSNPSLIWKIADAALKVKGVKMAHAVTGQFDNIVFAEFSNMEELAGIVDEIQAIRGVRRIQTLIAVPRPIRE
ncbi:MAG: Lrp/AsnC ligand binding domain-containing protein [Candidatus Bathyarchaeota archaeon]|nr:Lrp/AsnC ligand binding domain-containing protein [Candidatus Bathyarchaeota archaeon]MCX8177105.1 Lrp/AsnC ligand binding domain-containing protein [Candidatus Bathyarchaeota archaeon]MDW8193724.1 Lrp/AsnC ligand binding domain-containing protein [Nitrososphaerota archaeon]